MVMYSHSRMSVFEQCRFKYKKKYIEKVKPLLGPGIEGFMGGIVHDVLEWLYTLVKSGKVPSLDEVIVHYSDSWTSKWDDSIRIVKITKTVADYFNFGVKFLIDYYQKYKPFPENVLGLEKRIVIDLLGDGKYVVQGYIDRLDFNPETNSYEIHDYKTSAMIKEQDELDVDRQLALYSIGIHEEYGDDKDICLIWHFLAFDREVCSLRNQEAIEKLKKETIDLINEIEDCKEFPTQESVLCSWCEYRKQCPLWEHEYETDKQKKLFEARKVVDGQMLLR